MKNSTFNTNPYATNKGTRIVAPAPKKDEVKSSVISKNDMRSK